MDFVGGERQMEKTVFSSALENTFMYIEKDYFIFVLLPFRDSL